MDKLIFLKQNPLHWPNPAKLGAILVLLIMATGGLIFGLSKNSSPKSHSGSSTATTGSANPQSSIKNATPTPAPNPTPTPTAPTPNPTPVYATISTNDETASPQSISVAKGAIVHLTFSVLTQGTYYGGLSFESSVVNTGDINPGASKTVTFTANETFKFTPYWPSSHIQKGYYVTVNVI